MLSPVEQPRPWGRHWTGRRGPGRLSLGAERAAFGEQGAPLPGAALLGSTELPESLPSQRSSRSRARTSPAGTAGSGWSGCARPSPWPAPRTPHTWKAQSRSARGLERGPSLFIPLPAVRTQSPYSVFWFNYIVMNWTVCLLPRF